MQTLVLIPGLLSDARVWQPVADACSGEMDIYHADATRGTSISALAETVLNETQGSLIAVGHSMGGRIALDIAHIAPERVGGLVLANTGCHPLGEGEEQKRLAKINLGYESMEKLVDQWLPPMLDPSRHADVKLMSNLREMVLQFDAQIHERQIRSLIHRPNAEAYLSSISCPVLLLAARHDTWSPITQHERMAELLPEAQLVIIERAGHFAPVERPDTVTSAIIEWLCRSIKKTSQH